MKLEDNFDPKIRKTLHVTNITDIKDEKIDKVKKMHTDHIEKFKNQSREEIIQTSFWM